MGRTLGVASGCLALLILFHGRGGESMPKPSPAVFARCEAEAQERFNARAVSGTLPKAGLKRVRGSSVAYPDLPKATVGTGLAMHEVLIGPDGKVVQVWSVREPKLEPPFPKFSKAIADAVATWEYEPHRVSGQGVPVCMVVTTNINWR